MKPITYTETPVWKIERGEGMALLILNFKIARGDWLDPRSGCFISEASNTLWLEGRAIPQHGLWAWTTPATLMIEWNELWPRTVDIIRAENNSSNVAGL